MAFEKTLSFFLLAVCVSFVSEAQISSTFGTDADGWTFSDAGTPVTVNHNPSNGNPGGFVSATYNSNITVASEGWFAPAKFLGGHLAKSIGMNLKFDLQQSTAGTASSVQGDVRIVGASGFAIVLSLPTKPAVAPAWSSYTIKLDETAGWRNGNTGGTLANRTDVIRALSNIVALEIRGTYATNAVNTSGLDNVVLEQRTLAIAPTVTSFAPVIGVPGVFVTINGNNFGAGTAQNSVYFGGARANITAASATQITATVPSGAQHDAITVINLTTGLICRSAKQFLPTFDNNKDFGGRIIPSSFDPKDDIALETTRSMRGLSVGDLDGDGFFEIVVSEPGPGNAFSQISVFRNLGVTGDINATSFAPKVSIGRGVNGNMIRDMDGDGKLDVIVLDSDFTSMTFSLIYRNISTPGVIAFEAAKSYTAPSYSATALHIDDIDGDGRPDILGTHSSAGVGPYFWIHQNISTPGNIDFGSGAVWDKNVFQAAGAISSGDLDGDGKPEILVAHSFDNQFSIFHNISTPGTINLDPPVMIDPTGTVNKISVTDLDDDGKSDIIWAAGTTTNPIRIRKNIHTAGAISEASFDPEIVLPTTSFFANDLTLADMNGDGKFDIIATDNVKVGIFQNVSSGPLSASSFLAPVMFQGSVSIQEPIQPLIADIDGDHKPDIVTALAFSTPFIYIYRNTCFPAPVITNVTPATAEAGTALTITGNLLSTGAGTPELKLGMISSATGTASLSSVSTSVPVGAISERLALTHHGLTGFSKPLSITFPTSRTIDASSFAPPAEFTLTALGTGLAIGDFDDDGKTDVAVDDNATVRIFRNALTAAGATITTSTLAAIATTYPLTGHLSATDIDGDGKTDLIARGFLYRNNTGATADPVSFEPYVNSVMGSYNGIVTDHDFNHDGKSDFAIATNGNTYSVHENVSRSGTFTGTGFFPTITNTGIAEPAGGQVKGIVGADFDNDGYSDFAFGVNAGSSLLAVVRNTGLDLPIADPQFEAAVTFPALAIPFAVASADFDNDGKIDIVLGNNNAAFISIYHNTSPVGSVSFAAKQDIAALTKAIDIKAVDLDGDGKAEIIVAHQPSSTTGSFTVFQNNSTPGSISFNAGINYPLTRGPIALWVADINLDARPDLIFAANGTTDALMIFENVIATGPVITINPQPASNAVCNGETATLTLVATGTTNITYQWQKFDGSVFANIANGTGYTGVTTASLSINTTGNFGAGDYRCKVAGDGAPDKFSSTATLTINAVPAAPGANGNLSCVAASLALTASGGSNGQYRWYDVATGGTALVGQTNATFNTPVITVTTTYYVSINNGQCESIRTAAVATISPVNKPVLQSSEPVVGGEISLCDGESVTLTAPSATSYAWSNGSTTQSITVGSGTHSVVITSDCASAPSDEVNVTMYEYPNAIITADGTTLTASPGDSHQWYRNGNAIAGATNPSFEFNVLEYGAYTVDVTDVGCTSTSDEYVYLITAVDEFDKKVTISPNPFSDALTVDSPHSRNEITITDAIGRIVRRLTTSKSEQLLLNDLQDGLYILTIKTEKQLQHIRITKKH